MKTCAIIIATISLIIPQITFADHDVYVPGYYRSDGTFVRPHIRKSPDSSRENNYGPSQNSNELMRPRQRDYDNDGVPNYRDRDDDNDGIRDNMDRKQYGRQ